MNFAYVCFVDDKVKKIVNLKNIKHGTKIIQEGKADIGKIYKVLYDDGEYYKANIICLGETYEEVENLISIKRPRLPLNRLINEMNETATSTTDSDTSFDPPKSLELKRKGLSSAHKENYKDMTSEILKIKEKKKVIKSKRAEEEEKETSNAILNENIKLKEEIEVLKHKLKNKDDKIEKLENLNYKLQEQVLEKWNDFMQNINSENRKVEKDVVEIETRKDGKVHLGRGIWLSEHLYDTVDLRGKNPTKFVRELALNLFGAKVLRNSSVTGTVSNRTKADAKLPLDPQKIMAIKDIVAWRLRNQGEEECNIKKICLSIPTVIAQKIIDLNRPSRPYLGTKSKVQIQTQNRNEIKEVDSTDEFQEQKEENIDEGESCLEFVVDGTGHLVSETNSPIESEQAELILLDSN